MKNNSPKITVMLASYKHPLWIGEAIESVVNQTFNDFELIIVDDGSNDGSSEIIKEYAKKDSRIKYDIFPENKGAVIATKRCYDLSSGEYLAIINSDDSWELDKLEKQVFVLDGNKGVGAVFGMSRFIDGKSNSMDSSLMLLFNKSLGKRTKHAWANFFFKEGNCICHPSILIRKECYERVGFYNPTLRSLPDFDMWVKLFWEYDIEVLDDVLINFRLHSFNESARGNVLADIRSKTETKQILNNFLNQINTVTELKKVFPEYKDLLKVEDDLLVPFYIAKIALKIGRASFDDFAFDVLYSEMSKQEVLNIIEANNIYSTVQLSRDVEKSDIYKTRGVEKITTFIKIPLVIKIGKRKAPYFSQLILSIFCIKFLDIKKNLKKRSIRFLYITFYTWYSK